MHRSPSSRCFPTNRVPGERPRPLIPIASLSLPHRVPQTFALHFRPPSYVHSHLTCSCPTRLCIVHCHHCRHSGYLKRYDLDLTIRGRPRANDHLQRARPSLSPEYSQHNCQLECSYIFTLRRLAFRGDNALWRVWRLRCLFFTVLPLWFNGHHGIHVRRVRGHGRHVWWHGRHVRGHAWTGS